MYAIKVELKLNNQEKTLMNQHIGFSRFIYNYGLSISKCVAQTYTVSKRGDKYYVAFAINAELIPPIQHKVFEPVGLDVNLTDGKYCVLSDGTEITYPKPLKAAITKLKKFQFHNRNKQLGNRRKGIPASNNARKYSKKLAKLQKKVADKRNDFLQKLTTDLVRKYRHLNRRGASRD